MSFEITINTQDGDTTIDLAYGQPLFVLGANGTGKSSLMQRVAQKYAGRVTRISAHRQTWLQSSSPTMLPSQKDGYVSQLSALDSHPESRWMEHNPAMRSNLTIFNIVDSENTDSRAIADAMRRGDTAEAERLANKLSPLAKINTLFEQSGIPIVLGIESGDQITAYRRDGESYSAAQLSDGERNALMIAADVLTARPTDILLIDEPERHLHRSIISPLLTNLFSMRDDCGFVIATHDLNLPIDNPEAYVLLVRSCRFVANQVVSWTVDLLSPGQVVDEQIRTDIVGGRRKIIFVEGVETSLDKPLYSLLFPGTSVHSKEASRDVIASVSAANNDGGLGWLSAWGIIDNDGRGEDEVLELKARGIHAIPFYSVESIYYHPIVISMVSNHHATIIGGDANVRSQLAISRACEAIEPQLDRLAARAIEKSVRTLIFKSLPTLNSIREERAVNIDIDVRSIKIEETERLRRAVEARDWQYLVTKLPIRESQARQVISRSLEFASRYQYEAAVLKTLQASNDNLQSARDLLGDLFADIY